MMGLRNGIFFNLRNFIWFSILTDWKENLYDKNVTSLLDKTFWSKLGIQRRSLTQFRVFNEKPVTNITLGERCCAPSKIRNKSLSLLLVSTGLEDSSQCNKARKRQPEWKKEMKFVYRTHDHFHRISCKILGTDGNEEASLVRFKDKRLIVMHNLRLELNSIYINI